MNWFFNKITLLENIDWQEVNIGDNDDEIIHSHPKWCVNMVTKSGSVKKFGNYL